MFRRLRRLFGRYSASHLEITRSGFAIHDEAGRTIGAVDVYGLRGHRAFVSGWTLGSQVHLYVDGVPSLAEVQLPRQDVSEALGTDRTDYGFHVEHGGYSRHAQITVEMGDIRYVHPLPRIDSRAVRLARLRLLAPFSRDLARAVPFVLRWGLNRDPALRGEVKRRLRLDPQGGETGAPVTSLLAPPGASETVAAPPETPITIVLPVYNAFEMLGEVLERVERHTDVPWHLVLIEDASPDERVRPFLREWAQGRADRVTLLENESNLGFIRSVNRGFAEARGRGDHVVLLNSDAFVPAGWATRLMRPIAEGRDVATVTPMSNDAEIFTVPLICRKSDLTPGEADRIDALARRFHPQASLCEAPTGVGFCMAMNIRYLETLEDFDTGFGRGYGEEVDWCQRVRAAGGTHLALPSLFVEHRGGSSFGSVEKLRLVQANNRKIAERYPRYDAEVQDFIRSDPLAGARFALAAALVAERQTDPVPVYLGHSMGGGAENYLARRLEQDLETRGAAIVLRVGGRSRWSVELHLPEGMTAFRTEDFAVVEEMLEPLGSRHLIYSCGVGDRDPASLPELLTRLKRENRDDLIEVLVHDFFPLSPSYCLLGNDGWFHGVPEVETADRAHQLRRPDGRVVSHAEWRAAWGRMIAAASSVTVFSQDSAAHVEAAFPGTSERIAVRPHQLLTQVPLVERPEGRKRVIGVLGAINRQKGAAVLAELSEALAKDPEMSLVLVGELDPAYALAPSAIIHGRYRVDEIPRLVARYGITDWLIPSIWPETFSYATHEALATGLPVWCFDLGAQAEAVSRAPNGHVVPLTASRTDIVPELLDKLRTATSPEHGVGDPSARKVEAAESTFERPAHRTG